MAIPAAMTAPANRRIRLPLLEISRRARLRQTGMRLLHRRHAPPSTVPPRESSPGSGFSRRSAPASAVAQGGPGLLVLDLFEAISRLPAERRRDDHLQIRRIVT